jgi:hypothetical protein
LSVIVDRKGKKKKKKKKKDDDESTGRLIFIAHS